MQLTDIRFASITGEQEKALGKVTAIIRFRGCNFTTTLFVANFATRPLLLRRPYLQSAPIAIFFRVKKIRYENVLDPINQPSWTITLNAEMSPECYRTNDTIDSNTENESTNHLWNTLPNYYSNDDNSPIVDVGGHATSWIQLRRCHQSIGKR